jgi:two-component system, NtrC family, sensor kinase
MPVTRKAAPPAPGRRPYVPIRIKIMIALLVVTTAVVSVITFTMANLFHRDKQAYIHDLASIVALNAAQESRALLLGYRDRLHAAVPLMARAELTQENRSEFLGQFFRDFPDLIAVAVYENGKEVAAAYDGEALKSAGLSRQDVQRRLREAPLALDRLGPGDTYVENSTLSPKLACLTLAIAHRRADGARSTIVTGMVRLDGLQSLATRSGVFDVFIADSSGVLLAHRDARRVSRHDAIALRPEVETVRSGRSAGITLEYVDGGAEMIGGFAAAGVGGLLVAAQIPKSAAFLAARDLLNRLLLAALALLTAAALTGLIWSRRFTRPLERLSRATRQIARGSFDVQVKVTSRDEIGTLAVAFNQMASGLQDREAALREAQAQIIQSEKLAAVGQLGAGIAHEVKNPLAGILGCAQLSLRKAEPGSPLEKNLLLIEKETKRCKSIIDNLLRFARQEQAVREPIEINRAVEDAVAIVSHQLELKQIKVRKDLAGDLPMVRGNANQLQQALMNLMINAHDALEGRPGVVTVSSARLGAERIELRVIDTGPGIAKEIQARIFEPFFTTKPRGQGTGLGLAVTYGIVKDHGGDIRVDSETGCGATFIITLPVLESEEAPQTPSSGDAPAAPGERSTLPGSDPAAA